MKHYGVTFKRHFALVESKIVQAMIQKTCYGYSTFAGLIVGEIQQKTDVKAWYHIASAENISDILTRGAPPSQLGPNSVWQRGPYWLVLQPEQWPATPPDMVQLSSNDMEIEEKF